MSELDFSELSEEETLKNEVARSSFKPGNDCSEFLSPEGEPPKKKRRASSPKGRPKKLNVFSPKLENAIQVGSLSASHVDELVNNSEVSSTKKKPRKRAKSTAGTKAFDINTPKSLIRREGEYLNKTINGEEQVSETVTFDKPGGGSERIKRPATYVGSDEYRLVLKRSKLKHLLLEIRGKIDATKGVSNGEKVKEINLEADTGIIGVLKATPSEVYVDLQGTRYKGHFEETTTMMLVTLGNSGGLGTVEAVLQSVVRCSETGKSLDVIMEGDENIPTVFKYDIDVNDDREQTKANVTADQAKAQITMKKLKGKSRGSRGKGKKKKR